MTRVMCVSSGRADLSILLPVWDALSRDRDVSLSVFLTGAHALPGQPTPAEVPAHALVLRGGDDLGGASGAQAARAMARIAADSAEAIVRQMPDRLVIVGDRLDVLPVAMSAAALNVPIVHLHGGEVTFGAIDDRVRHALTKLAHLHCVATVDAARRVARMGEEGWRIAVTGAAGLDTLLRVEAITPSALAKALDISEADLQALRIVTIHPETALADPVAIVRPLLAALQTRPAPTLFTAPNSDPGGVEIRAAIDAFVSAQPWARFVESLGSRLYPALLRHARMMIGNSSSGIIEAGMFGLPVVDIGQRQAGRLRGRNVTHCEAVDREIVCAIDQADAAAACRTPDSPYGDGHAASRIADVITVRHARGRLIEKRFCDIPDTAFRCPWEAPSAVEAGD
jgi:UDP-hydrolysing UDP-N-acetyl-D-glucosamine 2-epimerase